MQLSWCGEVRRAFRHFNPLEVATCAYAVISGVYILCLAGWVQTPFVLLLSRAGIRVVYPSEENQKLLMSLIYDYVKAGREITDKAQVQKLVDEARALGAQKMILGCTELPIAFEQVNLHQDTVDPTTILAQHAVQAVGAKVKASLLQ